MAKDALEVFFEVPRVCLSEHVIDISAALMITESLAEKHVLIPISIEEGCLQVAMADPTQSVALEDVRLYSGLPVKPLWADKEEIKIAIREIFTIGRSRLEYIDKNSDTVKQWTVAESTEYGEETPMVKLVDSLFRQAILEQASDIHWEPKEDNFLVRFRIDGHLELKSVLPIGISRSVTARLKVMAGMDVTERRIPQDGRIILYHADKTIDIRVSSFATVCGEKLVTRILDDQIARRSLYDLGMRPEVEEGVRTLLRKPHGLILITGPTGSGKTTTLYAFLRELKAESINIVSIEDPVEYRIPGVNQAQVNLKVGFDFADGLRAILRQDPDVIMVGEIRDKETARIATAAALTGHLVLSTLHTNTAVDALARMLDMEIEPYLVASAVCGVMAQRLVRKLCKECRQPYVVTEEMQDAFGLTAESVIYRAVGCPKCRGTGYLGRVGLHEYLPYNEHIKKLVIHKRPAAEIEKAGCGYGMLKLWDDALFKVAQGQTSLEEVIQLVARV